MNEMENIKKIIKYLELNRDTRKNYIKSWSDPLTPYPLEEKNQKVMEEKTRLSELDRMYNYIIDEILEMPSVHLIK